MKALFGGSWKMSPINMVVLTLILLAMSLVAQGERCLADPTDGFQVVTAKPQVMELQVVKQTEFCQRMTRMFMHFGMNNGLTSKQSVLMANGATAKLLEEIQSGSAAEYVDASKLARYASVQSPAKMNGFLPVANFLGAGMGLRPPILLALKVDELRFLPHARQGQNLLVVAHDAGVLTAERARKVAAVAQTMAVRINVVWMGSGNENPEKGAEARALAFLASVTGGAFIDLSTSDTPCANLL